MEENNKKIEELKNQIKVLQDAYDNDLKREINKENDQIQANRQKGINKLQEELKEVEIEKLSKLEERKAELEEILKKKESLNKDKEQLEQAIYEMNGENTSVEAKEYSSDLGKVNAELDSLKVYEVKLNGINAEIGEISEKYNIKEQAKENEIYSKVSYEKDNLVDHIIKLSDDDEIVLTEDLIDRAKMNIEGMTTYIYNIKRKDGIDFDKKKTIYLDEPIDFDMINKDEKYAYVVKDFLSPNRIERYSKEAEGKGVVDFLYVGNIQKDAKNEIGYKKRKYFGKDENTIYSKISKREYERKLQILNAIEGTIKEYGKSSSVVEKLEMNKSKLESIMKQRPDLYKDSIKDENITNQQSNNTIEKPNIVELNHNTAEKQNTIEENYNTANNPNLIEQNNNTKSNSIEEDNKNTSLVEYKKENRIIAWIKSRVNNIKEKFNAIKEKNKELDATGQAWQDYIDEQEGTTASKKNKFIENITQKGKLQSKEQQAKTFEAVKKWEQKNEEEITQEEIEK